MRTEFLGLSISTENINVSYLNRHGIRYELDVLASLNTTNNTNRVANILQTEPSFFSDSMKKIGVRSRNVVICVPEDQVLTRLVNIPNLPENEVKDAIYFAFKSMIPVDIDTQNVTFLPATEKLFHKDFKSYYVVSMDKSKAIEYFEYFQKAGYNLLAIETESLANLRCANYNMKPLDSEHFMIVDLGAEHTTITLNSKDVVLYSQVLNLGGNAMTRLIAADLGIDITQAEKLKVQCGLDQSQLDGKVANSIKPVVDSLLEEIQKIVLYHREKISVPRNLKLGYLFGGGASLIGLDSFLSSATNMLFTKVEPLKNIQVPKKLEKDLLNRVNLPQFASCIGVSLKNE
ncbi:hypothetical protein D6810_00070 [Candidatus Dojkabacteria bacterium]|uniref:Type IV pilus assembly protein PilM n=1 Tax=Candidatus Dojkabacteria bacterium TaxID=2099670 RepID=A0A3M0Z094_9BACT|nr:MAG: hypothetical protein D6810_00070 [Candidatus Dojkabacteria bacterium]